MRAPIEFTDEAGRVHHGEYTTEGSGQDTYVTVYYGDEIPKPGRRGNLGVEWLARQLLREIVDEAARRGRLQMAPRRRFAVACAALLLGAGVLQAQNAPTCGGRCGTERWPVKTLTDDDRGRVNLTPQETTVGRLTDCTPPPPRQRAARRRVPPVELQVYRVRARLVAWKREAEDRDLHLVIADPDNPLAHMVAEVPDVACAGVCRSRQAAAMRETRRALLAQLGAPPSRIVCFTGPPLITVTGVGFLDRKHGQAGLAPNGVKLHPILSWALAIHAA